MIKCVVKIAVCLALAGTLKAGETVERKIIYYEQPDYPSIAARMDIHGAVKFKIWISSDGTVRRVEYIGGHPLLAQSALKAVKEWKYEPSSKETTAQVEIKF